MTPIYAEANVRSPEALMQSRSDRFLRSGYGETVANSGTLHGYNLRLASRARLKSSTSADVSLPTRHVGNALSNAALP